MIEILIILLGLILLGIGYLLGIFKERHRQYLNESDLEWMVKMRKEADKQAGRTESPQKPDIPEMPLSSEDNINHEGVGIVMRPSAEELAKFAEPQAIKEAKQAISEELKKQEEIDKTTL